MSKILYAAYGSNLNHAQMAVRCPKARFVGTAILRDHALVFRRVADIEPAKGQVVPVGLWHLTKDCLEALDRYEGYPSLYGRKMLKVIRPNRKTENAIIYFMRYGDYDAPSKSYYQGIVDGYNDCGIPTERLTQALYYTRSMVEAYEQELVNN